MEKCIREKFSRLWVVLVLLIAPMMYAQPVEIRVIQSRDTLTVGDTIHVKFDVHLRDGAIPRVESWARDQKADVDFYDSLLVRRDSGTVRIEYTVAVFDTGKVALNPFFVKIKNSESDTLATAYGTDSIWFYVQSIVPDSAKDLQDVYDPRALPFPWLKLAAGMAVLLLLVVLIFYIRKRIRARDRPVEEIIVPKRPAHEIAYEKLARLRPDNLLTRNDIKKFYFSVSSILREYLENRFGQNYLELTTDEVKLILKNDISDFELQKNVLDTLRECDRVKFAKYIPDLSVHKEVIKRIYAIIEKTIETQHENEPMQQKEETQ